MKQYEYSLLGVLPPAFILIVYFIVILWKFRNLELLASWIAKMAFSDIFKVKKKKEDGKPKWLFKDIDLTCEKVILKKILVTSFALFTGMLGGTLVMFWQLLVIEVSSDCDVEDPSKDCFEVKFGRWPKQDPVNCSSASIQDGTTEVLCYKIVCNFGVATGASYGAFKLSTLAYSLGSSVLLNHEKCKILRILITVLGVLALAVPIVLMATPFGVVLLSTYLATIFQTATVTINLFVFLWGIPWNELIALKASQDNLYNTGLENPAAATDDN